MFLVIPKPPIRFDVCLGGGVIAGDGLPMSPTEFGINGALVIAKADLMSNVQDNLDKWLGSVRTNTQVSVQQAIEMDPTLGKTVEWCETMVMDSYGPIDWNGAVYFGAKFQFHVSAR